MTIDHGYKKLVHHNDSAKDIVVVNWCITDVCNYRCTYCLPGLNRGRVGHPDYVDVINFCKNVAKSYYPKKVLFEFTGGEVTIWHRFSTLIQELKTIPNVLIGVISNASKNIDMWDFIKDYINHVCLSYQAEFSDIDHYIEIVDLLSDHIRTHVNIMMHPTYFNDCIEVAQRIAENSTNVSMALQPLLVEFKDQLYDYTPEQLDIIEKQHELFASKMKWTKSWPVYRGAMEMIYDDKTVVSSAHRFIGDKTNRWTGWKCHAGVEQIVVDVDGNVWRGWCKEGGCLGNIKDVDHLNPEPIICQRDFCHCNFDIMCTKENVCE